jgi:GcrA cell cycle regulator
MRFFLSRNAAENLPMTGQHMIAPGQYGIKDWTPERTSHAMKLWREGFSANQIARALGGVTRNAVIGKMHRIRMPGHTVKVRSSPIKTRRVHLPKIKPQPRWRSPFAAYLAEQKPTPQPPAVIDVASVKLQDLEPHHCRWPVGDPQTPEFGFCGCKKIAGTPYCHAHALRAFSSPKIDGPKPMLMNAGSRCGLSNDVIKQAVDIRQMEIIT